MEIGVSLSPTRSGFGPLLFAGDLDEGLRTASRLGYDGVELSLLDSARIDRAALRRDLRDLNLKVYAIATGQTWVTDRCSLYSAEAARRQKAVDRMMAHIDLAGELGCMVIAGGIRGKVDAVDEEGGRVQSEAGMAALARCAQHAARSGVTLLLEPINRYETNVVNTLEEGLRLIDRLGSPALKLLPDTFHMNIEEVSISGSLRDAGATIGYIHFADSNRLAPGWGHIDFAGVLAALSAIGYRGPIGIEVLPRPDDLATATQALRHVRSLLERR